MTAETLKGTAKRVAVLAVVMAFLPDPDLPPRVRDFLFFFTEPLRGAIEDWWEIDSNKELLDAALACWWGYAQGVRLAIVVPFKALGILPPEWFRYFRRLGPPWHVPYLVVMAPFVWWRRQARRMRPDGTKANASWATPAEAMAQCGGFTPGRGIPFGRFVVGEIAWNEPLYARGNLGMVVVGGTESGKTAMFGSVLLTLTKAQSAMFTDIDGELTKVVRPWLEGQGHRFASINLLTGQVTSVYNLFDELDALAKRFGRKAIPAALKKAAEGIVPIQNELQPTFDEGGRKIWACVMAFVFLHARPEDRNLPYCYHLICSGLPVRKTDPPGTTPLDALFAVMTALAASDDGCGGALNALMLHGLSEWKSGQGRGEGNPFHGAAKRAGGVFDLPAVRDACIGKSDFLIADDLKAGNGIVSIVCSVGSLRGESGQGVYQPFVRLLLTMYGHIFETLPKCRKSVSLAICDEAQNLGTLSIAQAGPMARHYEYAPIVAFQDLSGAERTYGKAALGSMLANAGTRVFLATQDATTAEYVSRQLGRCTVKEKVEGTHWLWPGKGIPARYQNVERDLLNPQQVMDVLRRGYGRAIVFTGKCRPIIAATWPYWMAVPVWRYPAMGYWEGARGMTRLAFTGWAKGGALWNERIGPAVAVAETEIMGGATLPWTVIMALSGAAAVPLIWNEAKTTFDAAFGIGWAALFVISWLAGSAVAFRHAVRAPLAESRAVTDARRRGDADYERAGSGTAFVLFERPKPCEATGRYRFSWWLLAGAARDAAAATLVVGIVFLAMLFIGPDVAKGAGKAVGSFLRWGMATHKVLGIVCFIVIGYLGLIAALYGLMLAFAPFYFGSRVFGALLVLACYRGGLLFWPAWDFAAPKVLWAVLRMADLLPNGKSKEGIIRVLAGWGRAASASRPPNSGG